MPEPELIVIGLSAFFGSTIAAIAGLGGGILLLSVLLQFLDPMDAIPVHALIQVASNSSRAVIRRKDIRWDIVWRFALLLIPAGVLGLLAADLFPRSGGRVAISVFALLVVWKPTVLESLSRLLGHGLNALSPLGACAGFLNIPLGVTGPAIAPIFRSHLAVKAATIATFACAQTLGHLVKVGLFANTSFSYRPYASLICVGFAAVVCGSWAGTKISDRVSEEKFAIIFKITLTAIALRVIYMTF